MSYFFKTPTICFSGQRHAVRRPFGSLWGPAITRWSSKFRQEVGHTSAPSRPQIRCYAASSPQQPQQAPVTVGEPAAQEGQPEATQADSPLRISDQQLRSSPAGKFWGLMREKDRPWQKATIIHLCFGAPPGTAMLYQRLRPATMQKLLARRAQAEHLLREHATDLAFFTRRCRLWHFKVSVEADELSEAMLVDVGQQLVRLRTHIGTTGALLARVRSQGEEMLDSEYVQHAELLQELCRRQGRACLELMQQHLPYLRAVSDINSRYPGAVPEPRASGASSQGRSRQADSSDSSYSSAGTEPLAPPEAALPARPQGGARAKQQAGSREEALAQLPQLRPPAFDMQELAGGPWQYPPEQHVRWPTKGVRPKGDAGLGPAKPEPAAKVRPPPPAQQQQLGARPGSRSQGLFD